jgi:single-strand DNA-binding protein
MNFNQFIVSGNITRELELRYLPGGSAVVTYTVASNLVRYDDAGKKIERADFIPVTTFGKQAERDAKYLSKGSFVTVQGRMESWYDREAKRGGFNFRATNVEYGPRGGSAQRTDADDAPHDGEQGGAGDEWVNSYVTAERLTQAGHSH